MLQYRAHAVHRTLASASRSYICASLIISHYSTGPNTTFQTRRPMRSWANQLQIPFLTSYPITRVDGMKAYSGTGDKGETSLYGGSRVGEVGPKVGAYGAGGELESHRGG